MENQEIQRENQEIQRENQEIQTENQEIEMENQGIEMVNQEIQMVNQERTHILVAISQSSEKGYPNPSKRSRAAFEWTLVNIVRSNVNRFNIQLVHVQDPNSSEAEYEAAVDMLTYFEVECLKIRLATVSWIAPGIDTKVVICDEVERINADLLVMGSGKLGSFRRLLNRDESVSDYCLKHAECPVIIVNEKAAKKLLSLGNYLKTSSM